MEDERRGEESVCCKINVSVSIRLHNQETTQHRQGVYNHIRYIQSKNAKQRMSRNAHIQLPSMLHAPLITSNATHLLLLLLLRPKRRILVPLTTVLASPRLATRFPFTRIAAPQTRR
jgi:hypothetical protein